VSHVIGQVFANNVMFHYIYHQTIAYNAHITAVFVLMLHIAIITAQRTMPTALLQDNVYQWELKELL